MKQFKVIEQPRNNVTCEELLGELSSDGWHLIFANENQLFLDRDRVDLPQPLNEGQVVE
jgi:hypothetical protein